MTSAERALRVSATRWRIESSDAECSDVARGDVASGDVARGDVARGDVSGGDVDASDVSRACTPRQRNAVAYREQWRRV